MDVPLLGVEEPAVGGVDRAVVNAEQVLPLQPKPGPRVLGRALVRLVGLPAGGAGPVPAEEKEADRPVRRRGVRGGCPRPAPLRPAPSTGGVFAPRGAFSKKETTSETRRGATASEGLNPPRADVAPSRPPVVAPRGAATPILRRRARQGPRAAGVPGAPRLPQRLSSPRASGPTRPGPRLSALASASASGSARRAESEGRSGSRRSSAAAPDCRRGPLLLAAGPTL